jgi:ATP-dependent Clp protease ATP-binding subunit ClpC
MGARPLRRALQRLIEDPLADFVLGAELMPGAMLVVDRKGETEEVQITIVPAPERAEVAEEKVTVPPEEPVDEAEPDQPVAAEEE